MYIKRHAEGTLKKLNKMFGGVLVTGARQVGKTTLLKETYPKLNYVTLDDINELNMATKDAKQFLLNNKPPVIIDEVQYAPTLFSEIKMLIDRAEKGGQILMSGSQQFHLMKNVSESLAGRLGILNLYGLSLREVYGVDTVRPFIPTPEYLKIRNKKQKKNTYDEIWEFIYKGCMPRMHNGKEMDKQLFYAAYTKTYIERDVRALTQVGDEAQFATFMRVLAARTAQMLNLTSIANEVGINVTTAKRWLSILETSNIIYRLKPFKTNQTKRLVKTPKIYFTDTGLASYLTMWPTPEVMRSGAMAGAFFETFVVAEIIKSYTNQGKEPPIYYYRNKDGKEIDIIIMEGNTLYPIEIKTHMTVNSSDYKSFDVLDNLSNYKRLTGGVICPYDKLMQMDEKNYVIPADYL